MGCAVEPIIRTLDQVDAGSLAAVGGKGANLGELVAAGVPVPPAFVVTTEAYRRLLGDNDLWPAVRDLLDGVDYDDAVGIEAAAAAIRAHLLAAPVPADVRAGIEAAYAALGDAPAVSVRSSATAEDLPGASFAGQQDTYLHIVGVDAVVDAVRRCWASL